MWAERFVASNSWTYTVTARQAWSWMGVVAIGAALNGCAAYVVDGGSYGISYSVETSPNDAKRAFDVIFTSKSDRTLCLGTSDWPNLRGILDEGGQSLTLTAAGGVEIKGGRTRRHCFSPGKPELCEIRIKPREQMTGIIAYEEFGDPDYIASLKNKEAHFEARPYLCEERKMERRS